MKYKAEYAPIAKALCFAGATVEGLATYFSVSAETINQWGKKYPEFEEALNERAVADQRVIGKLYERAMGMEFDEETKEVEAFGFDQDGNEVSMKSASLHRVERKLVTKKVVRKLLAPDVTAQIFWLKNRQPQDWRDKQDLNLTADEDMVAQLNAGRDRVAKLRQKREKEKGRKKK